MKIKYLTLIALFLLSLGGAYLLLNMSDDYKEAEKVADELQYLFKNITLSEKDLSSFKKNEINQIIISDPELSAVSNSKFVIFPTQDLILKVYVNREFEVSLTKNGDIDWKKIPYN
tara:strand:- start:129 stop:476 length:348 start_codon:yes stop_codon:yes gene_type:complete